ncbi:spinocerebellar ataxia type 10 protein domain-containing protein [Russula dissimulans]|nr:spinocerebellar ataxia type 10 protein domain-containing protein [Russula dissimulans]
MDPTILSSYSQLLHSLGAFHIHNPSDFPALEDALNDLSRELVTNKTLRIQLGSQQPSIWAPLHELWNQVTHAQSAGVDTDDQSSQLLVKLAKFTRNLIADVPHNQKNAFSLEPQIRQLIYIHTSWSRDTSGTGSVTTRLLTQTLANLVTGNQDLLDQFWGVHMAIPEEQSVLIRLLGLRDLRSVVSALVLILNCVYDNSERGHALVTTSIGIRVCVSVLDRLEDLSDVSELEDKGKAFELGYAIFAKLFQFGFFPELYNRMSMDNEPVSPSQTTLLKLLDSFCHPAPTPFRDRDDHLSNLAGFLAPVFLLQAKYAQRAIQQFIGDASTHHSGRTDTRGSAAQGPDFALDGRLAGVCVTLVLLSTTLSSILLAEREKDGGGASTGPAGVVTLTRLCHDTVCASRSPTGSGFIEELLETLGLLDRFLPRVNVGKIKSFSPNGKEGVPGGFGGGRSESADAAGFPYLKRDLVRLLGILCHNCKAIQDRIRLCGGIPVVLNLCVIDDRNPYLREHALFALRNLLHNNPENQAVVDTFRAEENTWI